MEAPEKIHIAIRSDGDEWGDLWVTGPKGTAAPPKNAVYVDYTRSDLCTIPGELVERIKSFVRPGPKRGTERWTEQDDLLRDILAWHEGEKG